MHWGLVFTVELSKTGPVFRSLGDQVVRHLELKGIRLPGYDADLPWECPQDLPFVLLSGTGKDIFNKTHAPYDTFNAIKYTYVNLICKKPNLAHIPCPIGDDLIQLPLLRLGGSCLPLRAAWCSDVALHSTSLRRFRRLSGQSRGPYRACPGVGGLRRDCSPR